MKWAFDQLGAPLRYLGIKQGSGLLSSKATYDFVIPGTFALISAALVAYFEFGLGLFAPDGFVSGILDLLNLLIAFFIAALAAVATFDRPGLDDVMKGEPAVMKRTGKDSVVRDKILTHRQFICYLFGYLSFVSIMLLLALYAIRLVGSDAVELLDIDVDLGLMQVTLRAIARAIGSFALFFAFGQIVVTMLLGVYFLADRFQFLDDEDE